MPAPSGFLAALGQAFQGYAQDEQGRYLQRERQQEQDFRRSEATSARELAQMKAQRDDENRIRDDALKGIRQGAAPDNGAITNALQLGAGFAGGGAPIGVGSNIAADPDQYAAGRYQQITPSSYLDQTRTPDALATRRQLLGDRLATTRQQQHETFTAQQQATQIAAQDRRSAAQIAAQEANADRRADAVAARANQLSPAQATQVKVNQAALLNMNKAVAELQRAIKKGGMAVKPGKYKQDISSLQANAMIQFKEAANLGALSGPDMGLVEAALGNATSAKQYFHGGAEGVLAALKAAQQSLQARARTMETVYGVKMPAPIVLEPADDDHVQTVDEMIRAGKTDAEIRAALGGVKP